MTPDLINHYLDEILACVCDALENGICDSEPSLCRCPCRMFISWGIPPDDMESCCGDGQLGIWVERIYPYTTFPGQSNKPPICNQPLAMDLAIRLTRCYPTMNEDGSAPLPSEFTSASESLNRDLYLITWGTICCLARYGKRLEFVFQGSRPIAPLGGCASVEAKFTVQLLDPKPILA